MTIRDGSVCRVCIRPSFSQVRTLYVQTHQRSPSIRPTTHETVTPHVDHGSLSQISFVHNFRRAKRPPDQSPCACAADSVGGRDAPHPARAYPEVEGSFEAVSRSHSRTASLARAAAGLPGRLLCPMRSVALAGAQKPSVNLQWALHR
jgi:hypothetical protein